MSNFLCCFDVSQGDWERLGLYRGYGWWEEDAGNPGGKSPSNADCAPHLPRRLLNQTETYHLTAQRTHCFWRLAGTSVETFEATAKIHLRCYMCASPKGLYARNNVYNPPLSETGRPKLYYAAFSKLFILIFFVAQNPPVREYRTRRICQHFGVLK